MERNVLAKPKRTKDTFIKKNKREERIYNSAQGHSKISPEVTTECRALDDKRS